MKLSAEDILHYMETKNATVLDASIHFDITPQQIWDILNNKDR